MGESENNRTTSEQFVQQVSESVKMIFDLTSRIDERVKNLVERQNEADERLEKLIEIQNSLIARISVLESKDMNAMKEDIAEVSERLAVLESSGPPVLRKDIQDIRTQIQKIEVDMNTLSHTAQSSENKWNKIIDFAIKLGWVILAGYLLYRLGFPEPM